MSIILRPYQEKALELARDSIRSGNKSVIIQATCGAGKTVISSQIVENAINKGKRVVFFVHFRQLAYQAMERFTEFGIGDQVGFIMAGEEPSLERPVQIISIQTYERRLKLDTEEYVKWFQRADIVIYDEAHASIARTRKKILDRYKNNAIIIGLTATPARADGRPLNAIYQDIIQTTTIRELTDSNYLVPAVYYGSNVLPDLSNLKEVAGDYNQKELGKRVNKPKLVGEILENFLRIAPERQGVVFATNVRHSKYIRDTFNRNGVTTEHIDAHTPHEERMDVIGRFKAGDVQIVTNVGVFQEGADFPWCDLVILAKPSKSFPRYIQMASRGLRPWPGKQDCVIIDHAGLLQQHGMLEDEVVWSLSGKEKAWSSPKKKKPKAIIVCDQCSFVNEAGSDDVALIKAGRCQRCGFQIPDFGKKVECVEADLVPLSKTKKKKYSMDDKRRWFSMLEYYRREKGYAPGWTANQYRSRMGCWPRGVDNVAPQEPDKEVSNWIKYQQIKYAKSKKRHSLSPEAVA